MSSFSGAVLRLSCSVHQRRHIMGVQSPLTGGDTSHISTFPISHVYTCMFRMFRWLGPFFQRVIRTFGIGLRVKKCLLWAFWIGRSAENVDKSQGECKKKTLRQEKWQFSDVCGSIVDHIVPEKESVVGQSSQCFLRLLCLSTLFSSCFEPM